MTSTRESFCQLNTQQELSGIEGLQDSSLCRHTANYQAKVLFSHISFTYVLASYIQREIQQKAKVRNSERSRNPGVKIRYSAQLSDSAAARFHVYPACCILYTRSFWQTHETKQGLCLQLLNDICPETGTDASAAFEKRNCQGNPIRASAGNSNEEIVRKPHREPLAVFDTSCSDGVNRAVVLNEVNRWIQKLNDWLYLLTSKGGRQPYFPRTRKE